VSQLVELHGGTITADSPGVGLGTTFKVILPLLSIHHELEDVDMTRTLGRHKKLFEWVPSLAELRVLVVDDEQDARDLISVVLKERGAEVVAVESGHEALAEMAREQFDVLISDIGMPVMDGYELIEKVRQLPELSGGRVPAAALTAYAGVEDRMHLLASGYQMHVPKPVEPAELATIVANLAGRYATPLAV
jgi:CheY-like chemotaxis protein